MIKLTNNIGQWLFKVLEERGEKPDDPSIYGRSVKELVREQLNTADQTGDLMGSIAHILKAAGSKNGLNRDYTDLLRRSVLSPRELNEFKAQCELLGKEWSSCHRCHVPIKQREMVTYVNGVLYCNGCAFPDYVSCGTDGCATKLPVPSSISKILQKLRKACAGCLRRTNNPTAAPERDERKDNPYFISLCNYRWGMNRDTIERMDEATLEDYWSNLLSDEYLLPDGRPGIQFTRAGLAPAMPPTPTPAPNRFTAAFEYTLRQGIEQAAATLPTPPTDGGRVLGTLNEQIRAMRATPQNFYVTNIGQRAAAVDPPPVWREITETDAPED